MPKNKYGANGGPRTEDLATMLRAVSADPDADARRFSDAVNYLAGAHSKNYSIIYTRANARMAPLYDLSSGLAYDRDSGRSFDFGGAMSIGGRRKFGQVLRKHWTRDAEEMRLDPQERLARVAEFAHRIPEVFEAVLRSSPLPGADELAERLNPRLRGLSKETLSHLAQTRG